MTRLNDRIYLIRDDLMLVVPASESAFQQWKQSAPPPGPKIMVVYPGTEVEDWREAPKELT